MELIPETMNAFVLTGHGGMDKLEYRTDHPVPRLGDTDVLIRIHACGLNNTDVNTRRAWYSKSEGDEADAGWGGTPITFPRIQGADIVGTVVALGKDAPPELTGQRVMIDTWLRDWDAPLKLEGVGYYGSECDGGFAEYTAIDHRHVHAVNSTLIDAELATFATSWMTALGMLDRADVGPDDTVLITGASGGAGSALIGLANLRGATTIAMTSATKRETVAQLNPARILIRGEDAIPPSSVTVVADLVAGDTFPALINALKHGGRYVTSGAIAGADVTLDVRTLYLHDLTLLGSTVVAPGTFNHLIAHIERGDISPILAATYPLSDLKTAQQAFIDKAHTGNIVVTIPLGGSP